MTRVTPVRVGKMCASHLFAPRIMGAPNAHLQTRVQPTGGPNWFFTSVMVAFPPWVALASISLSSAIELYTQPFALQVPCGPGAKSAVLNTFVVPLPGCPCGAGAVGPT